ncbi:MAG: MBOAT family protein [Ignavibacteriae bacterium]|nr:MBOAT family protein [Ignavibacteriota bacterium]NOH00340.1 MBOAT family protein [Ignavibacteriota bacterium]
MLFNSIDFIIFFPIVLVLYFATPYKWRWILLLAASYYFYMSWKAEYLILILVSTGIDYFAALRMKSVSTKAKKKKYLILSIFTNLGILFGFKYFNFFSNSFRDILSQFNIFYDTPAFDVLLPVGISFYTFQTLSYSIDVYRGVKEPEKHLGKFALYVAFFPQLVAGPIERSTRLMPQLNLLNYKFEYDRVVDGLRLMLWGFFKKIVIADRLANYVNLVYNNPDDYFGLQILIATIFFAFQIFCDFSGYSDIAIGTAKVLGIDLMENFNKPYFAKSISEFWKRWHISLSTWFKDYLYISLGGNRVVKWRWYYNLFITFLVSGLWHGANWTFVIWGALHGFYLIFSIVTNSQRNKIISLLKLNQNRFVLKLIQVFTVFVLVDFSWIFFRANNLGDAFTIIGNLFVIDLDNLLNNSISFSSLAVNFGVIAIMEIFHLLQRGTKFSTYISARPTYIRWSVYFFITIFILYLGGQGGKEFIYFQF